MILRTPRRCTEQPLQLALLLPHSGHTLRERLVGIENARGRAKVCAVTDNVPRLDEPSQSLVCLAVIQDGVLNAIRDCDNVAQTSSTGLTTRVDDRQENPRVGP